MLERRLGRRGLNFRAVFEESRGRGPPGRVVAEERAQTAGETYALGHGGSGGLLDRPGFAVDREGLGTAQAVSSAESDPPDGGPSVGF